MRIAFNCTLTLNAQAVKRRRTGAAISSDEEEGDVTNRPRVPIPGLTLTQAKPHSSGGSKPPHGNPHSAGPEERDVMPAPAASSREIVRARVHNDELLQRFP